ncbi:MAG: acyl carrier protein [Oscillospiraceae bacterium]
MDRIIEILEDIKSGVDYNTCTTLIDDAVFDSFDIIGTINALNDEYDIEIPATEIMPDNFNSAAALWKMVQRVREE